LFDFRLKYIYFSTVNFKYVDYIGFGVHFRHSEKAVQPEELQKCGHRALHQFRMIIIA